MDYSHIHTHTFNLFSSLRCKAYSKNGKAYTHKVYTVFFEQLYGYLADIDGILLSGESFLWMTNSITGKCA